MKLFIWTNYRPDWSGGLAFAIAEDQEQAQAMIVEQCDGIPPHDWGYLEVRELNQPVARQVSGGS